MKKSISLMICMTSIFVLGSTSNIAATPLPDEMISSNVTIQNIRRMWKTGYLVHGYGPYTIYFNDGYFHGYLQRKVHVAAGNIGNWSEYEGWVYPVKSPLPMPTKAQLVNE